MLALAFLSILVALTFVGASTNITIDDQFGDELTGQLVYYVPVNSGWQQGSQCPTCSLQPDPHLAYKGTWHDSKVGVSSDAPGPYSFTLMFAGGYWKYCSSTPLLTA